MDRMGFAMSLREERWSTKILESGEDLRGLCI
jgi:hypothetical protein